MNKTDEEQRLVNIAMQERFLGPAALANHMDKLVLIEHDGKPVGFATPFRESDGRWRAGSIFIEPKYRGKNIARNWLQGFFKDKPGRAWIEPANKPSSKTFTVEGFVKSGRTTTVNGKLFEEYITSKYVPMQMKRFLSW